MNDPAPLRNDRVGARGGAAPSYAGRTRYTQLEYEALLANASIGIAFTRDKRFFLCNPKFAEMFGYARRRSWSASPARWSIPAATATRRSARIAVPLLAAGRQLDVEWELKRRDGSTVLCRVVAKAIDDKNPQQGGTVWIVDDVTERRRQADEVARLAREQEAILGSASIGIVFLKRPQGRALQPALRGDVRLRAGRAGGQADLDPLRQSRGLRAARPPPTSCSPAARPRAACSCGDARTAPPSGRAATAARSTRTIR